MTSAEVAVEQGEVAAAQRQRWITRAWERTWFSPGGAASLVLVRTLVFLTVAVDVVTEDRFRTIAERGAASWQPLSIVGVIFSGPPSARTIDVLIIVAAAAAVATTLYRAPRTTGLICAISYTLVVLAHNSFGKIDHDRNAVVISVWIVALAAAPRVKAADSGSYRWPVQGVRLSLGLMFAAAAWAKASLGPALDWVLTSNMRNILASEVLIYETADLRLPPLSDVSLWIARYPLLWKAAAAGALIGEAVLIVSIFVRRPLVRWCFVAAGLAPMFGITLLMGMVGFPILPLAAAFLDLDDHGERSQTRQRVLLGCRLTFLAAIAVVAAVHRRELLVMLPLVGCCVVVAREFWRQRMLLLEQ